MTASDWAPLRAEQSVRARHVAASRNILLVEDVDSNAAYAAEALELLNCTVCHANTGREAVDLARVGRFDVILMDYGLPDIDGLEAVHLLRLHEACRGGVRRVPVVMVTASAMCTQVDRYFSAGVNDVLIKPFSVSQLAAVIDRWCALPEDSRTSLCAES